MAPGSTALGGNRDGVLRRPQIEWRFGSTVDRVSAQKKIKINKKKNDQKKIKGSSCTKRRRRKKRKRRMCVAGQPQEGSEFGVVAAPSLVRVIEKGSRGPG